MQKRTDRCAIIPVTHLGPSARFLSHNDLPALEVEADTGNAVLHVHPLQLIHGIRATPEIDPSSCRDRKHRPTTTDVVWCPVVLGERHEFASLDLAIEDFFADELLGGHIEPAERLVGRSDDDTRVLCPNDNLDGALVDASANFVALGRGNDNRVACTGGVGGVLGEVKDAQLLLVAASGYQVRVVGGVGDGAYDVVVLDGVEDLAGVGVPNLAIRKVR